MQGKRTYVNEIGHLILDLGEYGKDKDGRWWIRVPKAGISMGYLDLHQITEHEDGTITVSPSILCDDNGNGLTWHGYLERGIWREV